MAFFFSYRVLVNILKRLRKKTCKFHHSSTLKKGEVPLSSFDIAVATNFDVASFDIKAT